MNRYSAVLFDFDGTIADTASDVWNSVRYGFETCGLVLPDDFASNNQNLAMLVCDMVELIYPGAAESIKEDVENAVAVHYRQVQDYSGTVLYSGIEELLVYLKEQKIPTGILSNKGHLSLGRILKLKGWDIYFDKFRGSMQTDDSSIDKDKRLGLFASGFDMATGVYIGDSPGDIKAAKSNGIRSVGVLYGDGDAALVMEEQPDVVCATPLELRDYILKQCLTILNFAYQPALSSAKTPSAALAKRSRQTG